ncbi:L,D-transpeptidase [Thermogemmatispora onikobensis]|uniref:L,D-transpeptidase n=1 Tax=Thermogemmatispora onikobensis TaxID=732234 RepID=UPI000853CCF4|nr:L,D-transpeptidase [Thermogemmatispora onikobensis]
MPARPQPRARPPAPGALLLLSLMLLLLLMSACGGDSQARQQASQSKDQLDQLLHYALSIGVPATLLQPIQKQEAALSSGSPPFSPFDDRPVTAYYTRLTNQYKHLQDQTQQVIHTATEQFQTRAQQDMQNFQDALTARRVDGFGNLQFFTQQYQHDQDLMATARYPRDYAAISKEAQTHTQALNLMKTTHDRLVALQNTIKQLQKANIDVTAMQAQYQDDLQTFNQASKPTDFQHLQSLINAQYELAVVNSIQAVPYVGSFKLNTFKAQIDDLKKYGIDASSYQQRYNADKAAMERATTLEQYLAVSRQIDTDMAAMYPDLVRGEAYWLVNEIDRQARSWGKAHLYHDKFDGNNYILDAGYTLDGIGYWLNRELSWTYTTEDYQAIVDEEQNQLFNLHMMEQNYNDHTPYNKVHQTDLQILDHYHLRGSQVLMVSFTEQAMRIYDHGKLVNAFLVTTGRVERPALPGVWPTQNRESPTEFKSSDPPGSPYYYPPTHINYAILYHWGGFFVHDAWWRADFGPGTQFPHYDSGGDESFAGNGSHGCVNVQESQMAWLYAHTDWNTVIVIY